MKVLIIGATGETGKSLVEHALAAGHEVTALVRDPGKLSLKHERLRLVEGNVLRPETLGPAMKDQEAVISALGPASNWKPGTLISEGVRNILQAMKQNNVRLIIYESDIMAVDGQGLSFFNSLVLGMFRAVMSKLHQEKVLAEELIQDSGITWVIVRPPGLKHGPAQSAYRVGENLDARLTIRLPYADVADFMVKALTLETYRNKALSISA